MRKRLFACVLLLAAVLLICPYMASGAAGEEYPPARALPALAGNDVEDIIAVARSQVGYAASATNLSEYWVWAGSVGTTHSWCTEFVCWCAAKANIPQTIVPLVWSSGKMRAFFSARGTFYSVESGCTSSACGCAGLSSKTLSMNGVRPGDILLVDTDGNMDNGPDHTVLVSGADGKTITIIDGNVGGKRYEDGTKGFAEVRERTLNTERNPIHGVCRPVYTGSNNNPDPVPDPDDKVGAFVTRCYKLILNREPDAAGLSNWTKQLKAKTKNASEIIHGFMYSKEYTGRGLNNGQTVEILYNTMLNRPSDAAGKANWVAKLAAGAQADDIINGFCGSQEFKNLCSQYGIEAGKVNGGGESSGDKVQDFVSRCYKLILNRGADAGGLANWTSQLKAKAKNASEIIYGFMYSPEYTGRKLGNEQTVEILYKTMLNRGADAAGKASWLNKMANGATIVDIINGFCGSQEFTKLCAKYGIVAGRVAVKAETAPAGPEEQAGTKPAPVQAVSESTDDSLGTAIRAVYISEEKAKEFVSRCYRNVLGREAGEKELASWAAQMVNGQKSPDQIARGFLFSDEFKNRQVGNEETVRIVYRVYLNREADGAGLAMWKEKLDGGMPLKEMLGAFAKTNEYRNAVDAMGR